MDALCVVAFRIGWPGRTWKAAVAQSVIAAAQACRVNETGQQAERAGTLLHMKIGRGLSVRIEYELKIKGGEVIESSARSGPLQYVQGAGKMLAGLEKRLEGLSPGDERSGNIPAAEAFGTEDALPVKEMARKEFPAGMTPASV